MIKLDERTDRLLEEIATAKEPTPELLRKVIPGKKAFESFLRERGLLEDSTAQSLLATVQETKQAKAKSAARKAKESRMTPAALAGIINKVAAGTGLQKSEIRRLLPKLVRGGHLVTGWRRVASSLPAKKVQQPVAARREAPKARVKGRKMASRKARRREA